MKKTNLVTININGVSIECTAEQAIAIATACGTATQPSKPAQTSAKSAPKKEAKTSGKKSSSKSAPATKSSNKVADFEPKKDSDGQYNYKSWKTCRRNYVASKLGKDLTKEWVDYAEFCKVAAPFDKKFPYVKKSDR